MQLNPYALMYFSTGTCPVIVLHFNCVDYSHSLVFEKMVSNFIAMIFESNLFNPLSNEFFSLVLEKQPKIGSNRLPTHRRGVHRNFFDYLFIFEFRNFGHTYTIVTVIQQRVKQFFFILFNYLSHEFFFSLVLERQPKIGSYRLPTHRRSSNRNCFDFPFLFFNLNFGHTYTIVTDI